MTAWALKLVSLVATLAVLAGSYAYAVAHPWNPAAPLQPPVPDGPARVQNATASPEPIPALVGTRRGNPPRPASSPVPLLNLQPGVQATSLPEITFTHVS
jgi:hypothetical protein